MIRGIKVDGHFSLDLNSVFNHIENADTFSIFFPKLRRALIVDMRRARQEAPLVRVMPMARSAADRLRSVKRIRPHLPRPTEIVAIPWTAYVNMLVSTGVWGKVTARIATAESSDANNAAKIALEELRQIERQELASLIKGDQYETIWARPR